MKYPTDKNWGYSNTFSTSQHYDITCPVGTKVYAVEDMQTYFAGISNYHSRDYIGNGEHGQWQYGHFSILYITSGFIKEGQLIGLSGGWPPLPGEQTTGPHLHLRLKNSSGESLDWVRILEDYMSEVSDLKLWLKQCGDEARNALKKVGFTEYGNYPIDKLPDLEAVKVISTHAVNLDAKIKSDKFRKACKDVKAIVDKVLA